MRMHAQMHTHKQNGMLTFGFADSNVLQILDPHGTSSPCRALTCDHQQQRLQIFIPSTLACINLSEISLVYEKQGEQNYIKNESINVNMH